MTDSDNNKFPTFSHSDSHEHTTPPVTKPKIEGYEIVSELGEGGCGIVYLAQQNHPIKRRVALKVIKPGMDSKRVIARFEAERQALALLNHPNISGVINAGITESGRPYFAMEYVKGVPITEYCDRKKLNIEERLRLFLQVCDAVEHAHQKGIIHRDIKPSNILVSIYGDKAVPKVIDFGVAKAINQPLTERTIFTEQGQLIGTPEYMSPEQAEMTNQDIDTRSDIYSLGVLLYELLTGTLPFEPETLRKAAFSEIQRIIRDEEPPHPSTRISSLGDGAIKIAQNRQTEIKTLSKHLRKELEWIPMMAMRKERNYRYKSASDFAEDVQNYLNGNPLVAGPESMSYRFKKFSQRNRSKLISVSLIILVITCAFGYISTKYSILIKRYNHEAKRYFAEGKYENAEKSYAKVLLIDKNNEKAQKGIREVLLFREMNLCEKYLEVSKYGEAFGIASSLVNRFPNDNRVAQLLRRANGTSSLSVKFELGTLTQAKLKKVSEHDSLSVDLSINQLISHKGIDIDPGWYWLKLFYNSNEKSDEQTNESKKYLLLVRREQPYNIHAKEIIVGENPQVDYASFEEAMLKSKPGHIIQLMPGDHPLGNTKEHNFYSSVPNLTIKSYDENNQARIVLFQTHFIQTWDIKILNVSILGKKPWEGYANPGSINIKDSVMCSIRNSEFQTSGIEIINSDGIDIQANNFIRSDHHMIRGIDSQRVVIRNNRITSDYNTRWRSFVFDNCKGLVVLNNIIKSCSLVGIDISNCAFSLIVGNELHNNREGQITINNSQQEIIAFNTIISSGDQYGIKFFVGGVRENHNDTLIVHNQFRGGRVGLSLTDSWFWVVICKNNLFENNQTSILFESAGGGHRVENNIFNENNNIIGVGSYNKQWWTHGTLKNNIMDRAIAEIDHKRHKYPLTDEGNIISKFKLERNNQEDQNIYTITSQDNSFPNLQKVSYGPISILRKDYFSLCNLMAEEILNSYTKLLGLSVTKQYDDLLLSNTEKLIGKIIGFGPPRPTRKSL